MINKIYIIFIASILTFISVVIIPEEYFRKYKTEDILKLKISDDENISYKDINGDGNTEFIEYTKNDILGRLINITKETKQSFINNFNLPNGETAISNNIKTADVNKNGVLEIYFISANKNLCFLNILEFDKTMKEISSFKKIVLDSIKIYNNLPDVYTYNLEFIDNNKIIFELQSGFSIQPRKLYLYDIKKDTLIKTKKTSIASYYVKIINYSSKDYFFFNGTYASGNTISLKQLEKYSKSKNKDTTKLYREYKNRAYKYGDFASYTLLYNSNLEFQFPPLEYLGMTSRTNSDFVIIDNKPYIISLSSKANDTTLLHKLNLINFKGEIVKTKTILNKQLFLFPDNKTDKIIIKNRTDEVLEILSKNLEIKEIIEFPKENVIIGFKDLDNDGTHECVMKNENNIIIYQPDFEDKTSILLDKCNSVSIISNFDTFKQDNQTFFHIKVDNVLLVFKYYKNNKYYLKYFVYIFVFLSWYFLILGLLKINSHRLEAENLKMEQIVKDRTIELAERNKILNNQKEEISAQSEELQKTNNHLIELTNFKETITSTIVHDLKNPLNSVINLTSDKKILQVAQGMLNLVMNILDVQRYENSRPVLNYENCYLSDIIENAVIKVEILLEEKNIKIEHKYTDIFLLKIDKEIITRVFENLFTNAIKFSPFNEIIMIKVKKSSEDLILIEIIDNGAGIQRNKLNLIFDKFQQDKEINYGNVKSTGLGLTFCKIAVEAHGGSIRAKNRLNGGTVFSFTVTGEVLYKNKDKNHNLKSIHNFSEKELKILRIMIDVLRKKNISEASEVLKILEANKNNEQRIINWKNKVEKAVFTGNEKLFNKLIDK